VESRYLGSIFLFDDKRWRINAGDNLRIVRGKGGRHKPEKQSGGI
jgi:hypothetical protein